jgi:tetrahydromethanopterin S-methyltransferase subunit B
MTGQEKYKEWKLSHKVNMRVYTDEDMFVMGFDSRNEQVDELVQLVDDLSKRLAELTQKKKSKE